MMGVKIQKKNKRNYKGEKIADLIIKSSKKLNQLIVQQNLIVLQ